MSEFWIWERGQGYTEDSEENHLKTWVRKFWYVLYQQVSNYIHLSLDYRKTLQWVRGRIVLRKPICRSSVHIGIPKILICPRLGQHSTVFPFSSQFPSLTLERKDRALVIPQSWSGIQCDSRVQRRVVLEKEKQLAQKLSWKEISVQPNASTLQQPPNLSCLRKPFITCLFALSLVKWSKLLECQRKAKSKDWNFEMHSLYNASMTHLPTVCRGW